MKRIISLVAVGAMAAVLYGVALAEQAGTEAKTCSAGTCPASTCAAAACDSNCSNCAECPIAKAMEALPKITFAVGKENTCCDKTAAKLAKESGAPIHYVVAKKEYASQAEATEALAVETEKFVHAFAEPQECKETGTVTVAGKEHCCKAMAAETAQKVKDAMAKVKMTYLVGEKECHCPAEANQLADSSGEKVTYAVLDQKTHCDVSARLNLARAQYRAAVEALVKAQATGSQTPDDA